MIWFKRIGLLLLVLFLLVLVGVSSVIAWDVNWGEEAADNANASFFTEDGAQIQGYLARPEGTGEFPTVLMLHEWWGLNEEIPHLADALMQEGYAVFVPDLYRNRVANTVPGALWMRLTTPDELIWSDVDAALALLQRESFVQPGSIATVGFCFGGQQSLQLGLRQPDQLAAVVLFYGSVVTEPSTLAALAPAGPLLGIFGAEDQQIPVQEVQAFRQGLEDAGIENTVSIYDGVGHAFITPESYGSGTAGQAWQQMLAFLHHTIGTSR